MLNISVRAALLAFASPALLAAAQPSAVSDEKIAELREAALEDDIAYGIVADLTTEIGPRLAGTEAEARARQWAVQRLGAMGFSNVRVEEFDMPTWVRGKESAHIVAPFPQELIVTAFGNSGSTGDAGLVAEVVGFKDYAAFLAAPASSIAGKIVFISHAMPANQDGSGYGNYGTPRFFGPKSASERGAAAIFVKSIGTDSDRLPHTGTINFGEADPIPAGALSVPDAQQLERVLARGRPVTLKLVMTPRQIGIQKSGNVIAEVPGRNPDAKKLLVSCHIDSWDNSPGVFDDGAGCGIVAAAAKRIMDAGQPYRTIEIVWFGAEEVGIHGGRAFAETRGGEDYHLVAESDFGADRVWRVDTNLGEDRKEEADALRLALYPLSIVPGRYDEAGGADIGPIMQKGAPGVSLRQDGSRYFDLHHTANDTLDKLDKEQLAQNVAAWTTMLAVMSGGIAE
ncbi:M28 family peptidase [Sphingomicrobium lutaoense]|uniref:Carboxypeptidase Q n=1 Tax=Sphingomicrobium lutaoense TaxID=515949 RepID=A0A839Z1Y0_9SPHN|nr:M28 family peptidase [Sphingomicrobium lutaoense]MBB3763743.1 Zn-dependent M28 family amino/carboxypeptidase [Sphingomicrobium lutaoense]